MHDHVVRHHCTCCQNHAGSCPDACTRGAAAAAFCLWQCCRSKACLAERNLTLSTAAAALPARDMCDCERSAPCHTNGAFLACVCHCTPLLTSVKCAPQLRSQQGLCSSRQAQEQGSCDEGCGARACVVRGAVTASCMRPVTLCRCLSCWAALPVTRSETLTHSPRCAGPAVATQRSSSSLSCCHR